MRVNFDDLLDDEKIYELKTKGFSYDDIAEYYSNQGIEVSSMTIGRRCRKIFAEKGEKVPDLRSIGKEKVTSGVIFRLRQSGFSYRKISEHFKEQGINISISTVRNMCKEAYASANETDLLAQESRIGEVPEQRIFELREEGLTFEKISITMKEEGYNISKGTVRNICIQIYARKGLEQPKIPRGRKPNMQTCEMLEDLDKKVQNLVAKKEKAKEIVKGFEHIELSIEREDIALSF